MVPSSTMGAREVLLGRGRGPLPAHELHISRDVKGLDRLQRRHAVAGAEGQEVGDGPVIGPAGVRIADLGREELQEA